MSFICEVCSTWYFNIENHCCVCKTPFDNEEQFTLHCCDCKIIFSSQEDLSRHICGLELEENQPENARVEQELMSMIDLQLGIGQNVLDGMDREQQVPDGMDREHQKVKNKRYKDVGVPNIKCDHLYCKEVFWNYVEYQFHLTNDHFRCEDSPCPEFSCWRLGCERSFYTHDELDLHLRNHYLNCWRLECPRTFPTKEELDLHIRNDHDELHLVHEPEFSCSRCHKTFRIEEDLNYHLQYEKHEH